MLNRRTFLRTSSLAAGSAIALPAFCQDAAPSKKLNVAIVGPCGRGWASFTEMMGENIVAVCDVDRRNLDRCLKEVPSAKTFTDFRKLFETVKDIDAVCVCTPDHTHAAPSVMAMRAGIHCYTEKPLTHDVRECRVMQEIAEKNHLVTQMGTQIHAGNNYRRVVEKIQAGAIGPVREIHVWCGKGWGHPADFVNPTDTPEIPDWLDWDSWLGPAKYRPYNPCYLPANWRKWWAFGTGTMGDMACHYMDLPFWALELRDCLTAEAIDGPAVNAEGCPLYLTVKFTFAARSEKLPACTLTWYDGDRRPTEAMAKYNIPMTGAGVLFVGDDGAMYADYGTHKLYPEEKYADYTTPETIPNSIGHHREWLQAIRDNKPENCTCKFGYSGRLTETVLLGTVAYRVGQKLEWDAAAMKVKNCPAANDLITVEYRDGWIL